MVVVGAAVEIAVEVAFEVAAIVASFAGGCWQAAATSSRAENRI
jgi:hypothetical protein